MSIADLLLSSNLSSNTAPSTNSLVSTSRLGGLLNTPGIISFTNDSSDLRRSYRSERNRERENSVTISTLCGMVVQSMQTQKNVVERLEKENKEMKEIFDKKNKEIESVVDGHNKSISQIAELLVKQESLNKKNESSMEKLFESQMLFQKQLLKSLEDLKSKDTSEFTSSPARRGGFTKPLRPAPVRYYESLPREEAPPRVMLRRVAPREARIARPPRPPHVVPEAREVRYYGRIAPEHEAREEAREEAEYEPEAGPEADYEAEAGPEARGEAEYEDEDEAGPEPEAGIE
jgi:hypothetical protein